MNKKIVPKLWKTLSKIKKERILRRSQIEIENYSKIVLPILKKVREEGDSALLEYSKKFDTVHVKRAHLLKVSPQEHEEAEKNLSEEVKKAIRLAYQNVYNYHLKNKHVQNTPLSENGQGVFIGSITNPIDSVGLYIPQGKGSFPSMVYMLAIPALIAEVPRIVMVSPPLKNGTLDSACLYAAKLCNIHEIYKIGGVQSIAALAYGTKTIPAVNKIIGPGSAIVSAAKHYVRTYVDVGLPAGPSESLIITDATTPADIVAYDLCIEAEHGEDSMAIVLTHKKEFAHTVAKHLNKIIEQAPPLQQEILLKVFSTYIGIIITSSLQESINISNLIAPEHLLVHSEWPSKILSKITNAGEILLGKHSPFSIANYIAGANAVLPTGGMARSYSGVSVKDFIKESVIIQVTPKGFEKLSPHVQTLAEYEGFYFHKKALEYREQQNTTLQKNHNKTTPLQSKKTETFIQRTKAFKTIIQPTEAKPKDTQK